MEQNSLLLDFVLSFRKWLALPRSLNRTRPQPPMPAVRPSTAPALWGCRLTRTRESADCVDRAVWGDDVSRCSVDCLGHDRSPGHDRQFRTDLGFCVEPPRGIEPRTYALREPLPVRTMASTWPYGYTATRSMEPQAPVNDWISLHKWLHERRLRRDRDRLDGDPVGRRWYPPIMAETQQQRIPLAEAWRLATWQEPPELTAQEIADICD